MAEHEHDAQLVWKLVDGAHQSFDELRRVSLVVWCERRGHWHAREAFTGRTAPFRGADVFAGAVGGDAEQVARRGSFEAIAPGSFGDGDEHLLNEIFRRGSVAEQPLGERTHLGVMGAVDVAQGEHVPFGDVLPKL